MLQFTKHFKLGDTNGERQTVTAESGGTMHNISTSFSLKQHHSIWMKMPTDMWLQQQAFVLLFNNASDQNWSQHDSLTFWWWMFLCKWRARKQIPLHRDNKVVLYCIPKTIKIHVKNRFLAKPARASSFNPELPLRDNKVLTKKKIIFQSPSLFLWRQLHVKVA